MTFYLTIITFNDIISSNKTKTMNLHNLKNLVIIGSTNGGLPTRNLVADVWVYPIETKEVPPLSGKSIFYQDPIGSSRSMGNAGSSITYKKFGFSLIRSIGTGISFSAMRLTYGVLIQLTKEKKNLLWFHSQQILFGKTQKKQLKVLFLGLRQ